MLLLVEIPDDNAKKWIRQAESNPKVHLKKVTARTGALIEEMGRILHAKKLAGQVRKGEIETISFDDLLNEL